MSLIAVYVHVHSNARHLRNIKSMKPRDLEVLRHPLFSHLSLGFPSLCDWLARLELALYNECSEPVIQQVALGLQETKRILQFVREHQFQRLLWRSVIQLTAAQTSKT